MSESRKALQPGTMDRDDWLWLIGMLFVLFATRLAWIVWNPDSALYWEEDYRWVAAREILAGPLQPAFDYQADNYQGGSLVLIALITCNFALFGESLLSFKLAPLAFAGATLVALYALGRLCFGRRVALLAGAGYLVGPPLLAHGALIPMGSHGESALFSLLQLICFLKILSRDWHTPRGWAALGFVSGLGLWFCYTSGLSLAACGLTWLILEGVPKPRLLLAATAGLLLGLIPWFAYNLQNDFAGLLRLLEIFGGGNPIDAWAPQGPFEKLLALIFRDLPIGLIDPFRDRDNPILAAVVETAFYLPVVIALVAGLGRVLRLLRAGPRQSSPGTGSELEGYRSEVVFYIYGLLFVAAYLSSSFAIEPQKGAHTYRLFLPLITVMWLPVAVSVARALDVPRFTRSAAIIGLVLAMTASALSSVALAMRVPELPHLGTQVREHVFRGYLTRGVLLHRKLEDDLPRAFDQARRVPDLGERFRTFQGLGWGIQYRYEGNGQIQPFLGQVDQLPLGEHVAVLSGLRWSNGNQIAQFKTIIADGEATPRQRAQLERLEELKQHLDRRWSRIPLRYQRARYIIYQD
ncbi:MAG: glycosyltransferase family 39 protein [Deltaproteobacteria bacterium]|nr:glycosyltransferase family 39 protein [Deltaproteobacteria bacterium]